MDFQYQVGTEVVTVKCEPGGGRYRITIADRVYDVQLDHAHSPEVAFTVDGARLLAQVAEEVPISTGHRLYDWRRTQAG